ncbi:MAG: hypothetical protein ACPGN3_07490 [Opitutales bacterium]
MSPESDSSHSAPPSDLQYVKVSLLGALLRPRQTLEPCLAHQYIPFTAMWAVLSAAGMAFYTMLPIYPRPDFEFNDFLATLGLLSPLIGLIVLRMAAWVLAKSGKFFGGKANTRLCHGALAVGLLPIGCSLFISLPLFILYPNERLMEVVGFLGLAQVIGTIWSLVNVVNAVAVVHQIKSFHAGVALMGMIGFMYAVLRLLGMFMG